VSSNAATAPLPCLLPSLVNTSACKLVTTQRSEEEPPFWLDDCQNSETTEQSKAEPIGAQGGLPNENKGTDTKQSQDDDCWNSPPEKVVSSDIPDTPAPLGSSEGLESEEEEEDDEDEEEEDEDDDEEEEEEDDDDADEGDESLSSSDDEEEEVEIVDLTGSQDEDEEHRSLPELECHSPSHSQSTPPLSQSPPLSQASPPPVVKQPLSVGSPFCFSVHSSPSPSGADIEGSESTSRIAQMRAALRQPITASPFTSPAPSPRPATPPKKTASPRSDLNSSNSELKKNLLTPPPSDSVIKERNERSKTPSPSPYLLSLSAGESRIEALRRALNEPLPKKDSPFLQRASPSA